MFPGMLEPMLKVAAAQLKQRIAKDGREKVVSGLALATNDLLYSLPKDERDIIVAVLCDVELVRHVLGAPQNSDAALDRVFKARA